MTNSPVPFVYKAEVYESVATRFPYAFSGRSTYESEVRDKGYRAEIGECLSGTDSVYQREMTRQLRYFAEPNSPVPDNLHVRSWLLGKEYYDISKLGHLLSLRVSSITNTVFAVTRPRVRNYVDFVPEGESAEVIERTHQVFPSDKLVDLIEQSRKQLDQERKEMHAFLNSELGDEEFSHLSLQSQPADSVRDDISNLIAEEFRLFVETVGRVSLKGTFLNVFPLTTDEGRRFFPSIASALILPFNLTTDYTPPFLSQLLRELWPLAIDNLIVTRHGRLAVLNGELVIEKKESTPMDLFT